MSRGVLLRERDPGATSDVSVDKQQVSIDKLKERLLAGEYIDDGNYKYEEKTRKFTFENPHLQILLDDSLKSWAISVDSAIPQQMSGDSGGKAIRNLPPWVKEYQEKLIIQTPITDPQRPGKVAKPNPKGSPQWNMESEVAQHLLESFFRAWYRSLNHGSVPGNVGELFSRVGDGRGNDRARMLGGDPNAIVSNWCGPASQNAATLALLKKGWRWHLRSGIHLADPRKLAKASDADKQKFHAEAFKAEVIAQSSYFLNNWFMRKPGSQPAGSRGTPKSDAPDWRGMTSGKGEDGKLQGGEVYYIPLKPGDYLTIVGPSSPLSGHVATVIKEEPVIDRWPATADTAAGTLLSTVYIVSGNAKNRATRVEVIEREMPPPEFDYAKQSKTGNSYDRLTWGVKSLVKFAQNKFLSKMRNFYIAWTVGNKELRATLKTAYPSDFPVKRNTNESIAVFFDKKVNINSINLDELRAVFGSQKGWGDFETLANSYLKEMKPQIDAAQVPVDDYAARQDVERNAYSKDQLNFSTRNIQSRKSGKYVPTSGSGRVWVAGIVRSGLLDPNKIQTEIDAKAKLSNDYNSVIDADSLGLLKLLSELGILKRDDRDSTQITDAVLGENGLKRMFGTIDLLWPGAIEYWEGLGAFR